MTRTNERLENRTADDDDAAPPAKPPNRPATIAFVAGLLSFVPGVGAIAIVAGLVAGNRARQTGGAGRGRAMTAVVLGIASLFLWAVLAGAYFEGRAQMKALPAIAATRQFVILVGDGNVAKARTLCVDGFDDDRLTDLNQQIAAVGIMQQPNPYYGGQVHSARDVEVQAELKFDKGTRVLVTHWTLADGSPKLTDFALESPTTGPAKP